MIALFWRTDSELNRHRYNHENGAVEIVSKLNGYKSETEISKCDEPVGRK